MDVSQNVLASTKQQLNSENIEENTMCNICARTFRTNRSLLQRVTSTEEET